LLARFCLVWKSSGGVKYDLADGSTSLQPGPQRRHCSNGCARLLPRTRSIPLYYLAMCRTDNSSLRPQSSLQSVIERPVSALARSLDRALHQLGWRRAPYKGRPRKRETSSAGTRAKIIHVGLECQKKPQPIYCHFQ
jgi:hypothetical protein